MNYSAQIIQLLTRCIKGNTDAFNKLNELGHPELAMLNYALSGQPKAMDWLENNKHILIFAFAKAIWDDDQKAIGFLVKHKAPFWAATAGYVIGDKKAKAWLEINKLNDYTELAEAILEKIKRESPSDFEGMFKSPIK